MMFRWRSRALALTLIAFIVLGTTGSGHAVDYRLPLPGHHHHGTQPRICPPADQASTDQCPVCHWLQSLRLDPGTGVLLHVAQSVVEPSTPLAEAPARPPFTSNIPARAPPA
jgi:hypothetical protein